MNDDRTQRPTWSFLNTRERRDSRRQPVSQIEVEIRLERDSSTPDWGGSAIDLNSTGMALVLPPELEMGTLVYLTFDLGSSSFDRLPGTIVRQDRVGVGAVQFQDWGVDDKMRLLTFLQEGSTPPED